MKNQAPCFSLFTQAQMTFLLFIFFYVSTFFFATFLEQNKDFLITVKSGKSGLLLVWPVLKTSVEKD